MPIWWANVVIALSSAGHLPFAHGPQRQDGHNRRAERGHHGAYQRTRGFRGSATAAALKANKAGTDQTARQAPEQDGDERKPPGKGGRERTERSVVMRVHTWSVRLPGTSKRAE